ncbi:hypothetical protein C8R48DRAFT_675682 [Suillus tomentosus]|nr:hypothetical protein C8R48DRAFT_675682 [Suillus tomentosus]
MFVLACPSASNLGFEKDTKMKHVQLTHSFQFHAAPSATTRFRHKVFEEDVGRVKGHFGPINTLSSLMSTVSALIVLPLGFNTIRLVYAHILLKPRTSAHIAPAPAPSHPAPQRTLYLSRTPQPQPPPRLAPTTPTHFQQAPVPSAHVRYTPTSVDATQTRADDEWEQGEGEWSSWEEEVDEWTEGRKKWGSWKQETVCRTRLDYAAHAATINRSPHFAIRNRYSNRVHLNVPHTISACLRATSNAHTTRTPHTTRPPRPSPAHAISERSTQRYAGKCQRRTRGLERSWEDEEDGKSRREREGREKEKD